jgi:hypothetical protein
LLVGRCLIDKLAKLDLSGTWQISGSSPWNSPPRSGSPHQGQLISPPRSAGTARLATAHHRNMSLTQRMSGSASRSGAKRARLCGCRRTANEGAHATNPWPPLLGWCPTATEMRVTVFVGEGVVVSAVSDPVDHPALTRAGSFEPGHSQERNRGVVITGMTGA